MRYIFNTPSTSTITVAIPTAMVDDNTSQQSRKVKFDNGDSDLEQMNACTETTMSTCKNNISDMSQESSSTSIAVNASTKTRTTLDRTLVFTVLIALVGFGVSAAFLGIGIRGADNDKRLQFEKSASERIKAVEVTWHDFEVAGLWIHEACRASADQNDIHLTRGICSRDDFFELYEYLLSSGLEFQAVTWVANVTHVDRASMEEDSRTCK
jgi:hypothetical protein